MVTMFPRSKNIRDGWSDSLTDIEKAFDQERAQRALYALTKALHKEGFTLRSFRALTKYLRLSPAQ